MRFIPILFFLSFQTLFAQSSLKNITVDIAFFADVMNNAFDPSHRIRANSEFNDLMEIYLKDEMYTSDDFQCLKGFANDVVSADTKLRIISWQTKISDEEYVYNSILINGSNKPYLLTEGRKISLDLRYDVLSSEDWYGALYYNIKDFVTEDGQTVYFVFGYNGFDKYDSFKILDVFYFDNNDLIMGKPIFIKDPEAVIPDAQSRIMLKYSSDVSTSINYNPNLGFIMYEHLISRLGQLEGQGVTMVPDGSYEGFALENGKLIYKEKLFDHIYETAPVSEEKKKKQQKDLFGKQRK